ncbi:MAG: sulfate ABC transporter permease subunit CysT [Gammaproteobacteria bacterium HGW-Gammaproteobacteria-6]|jgi:sulfate transport system permease protein|nr:MAG: sulfate ABC transporter permease subunit CysT [Gammaproteobacteria bacterium HGW-Gammaproteobacteria-6]PKM16682.1 MAG: sulfate ABC transporter permease subunit CysT [Gammaproteobacteria bacterium HGW-Gammaproteobacteria-2]
MSAVSTPDGSIRRLPRASVGVLPGFGLSLGYSLLYLGIVVLVPLSMVILRSADMGMSEFIAKVTSERAIASLKISFGAALLAALINAFVGLWLAWVLVRHPFPGRKIIDALIDLPIALPTAVAGIALTALYAPNGWIGQGLAQLGVKAAFTPIGIVIALQFVGLPFVVRTLQPVLEELEREVEEVAISLGARAHQIFVRVTLPALAPALITGFALAFARGIGEYGSVIFIAGNMPLVSEITPLLIVTQLEQYDYAGATALALVMLVAAFTLLLLINSLQARLTARGRR